MTREFGPARIRRGSVEPVAVAVVRAWIEGESPGQLKIRITSALDVAGDSRTIGTTTHVAEASAMVEAWLTAFIGGQAAPDDRSEPRA
ncbi:MAG: hypothetical protein L0227_06020 [Chloroflexi bacterium]|nr:hypothetical protein [Chloroflexota bacterium]